MDQVQKYQRSTEGKDFPDPDPPEVGPYTKVIADGANYDHTGTLVETTVKSVTVTGGLMRANGCLKILIFTKDSATANGTIIWRIKLGGVILKEFTDGGATSTPVAPFTYELWVFNRNVENSQYSRGHRTHGPSGGQEDGTVEYASMERWSNTSVIDTTTDKLLEITCTLGNIAFHAHVRGWFVEVFK